MTCNSLKEEFEKLSLEANCEIHSKEFAEYLDDQDKIKDARNEFSVPKNKNIPGIDLSLVDGEEDSIYFNGNSLGLCPIATESAMLTEIRKWKDLGSHGRHVGQYPWEKLDETCIEYLAKLIGAKAVEVAHAPGLTLNIHLMMVSFYNPTPSRHKIIIEYDAFISDHMAVESQIRFHGYDPRTSLVIIKPRKGEVLLQTSDIIEIINKEGDETSLVFLGGVNYYTGQKLDMKRITKSVHKKGCKVGFDLAHAVGNVELKLHDWNVDFACWCSYKYLNSGHGSTGGIFLHEKHARDTSLKKFKGWWTIPLDKRFDMDNPNYSDIPGARSYVISNTSLFATIPLFTSLDIFKKYGWGNILEKQRLLTGYLEYLIRNMFNNHEVKIYTPAEPEWRGCQLSLAFNQSLDIVAEQLSKRGVTFDTRKPSVIRIAPVPLYNTYADVLKFCKYLRCALNSINSHINGHY